VVAERVSGCWRSCARDTRRWCCARYSLAEEVPASLEIEKQQRFIAVRDRFDAEAFVEELGEAGYERVPQVTERGAVRRPAWGHSGFLLLAGG